MNINPIQASTRFRIVRFLMFLCLSVVSIEVNAQQRGGRPTPTPAPATSVTASPGPRTPNPALVKRAVLKLSVPEGCRVFLDDVEVEVQTSIKTKLIGRQPISTSFAPDVRTLTIKGLKAGSYRLAGRKPDYKEFTKALTLTNHEENLIDILLIPIPGKLTVRP